MKIRSLLALVLSTLLVLGLSGCSKLPFFNKEKEQEEEMQETPDPNFPVELYDITIEHRPERVVALSAAILEKIYDLGLEEVVVGVPDFINNPAVAVELPPCGTGIIPNLDAIEETKADLLLTSTPLSDEDISRLGENGIVTLTLADATTPEELWQLYRDIALALEGRERGAELGEELVADLSDWLGQLAEATSQQEAASVLYLRQLDFNLATSGTLEGELLHLLGFKNIAYQYTDWLYPSKEAESAEGKEEFRGVDYLFFGEPDVTIKMLEQNAFYKGLPAVLKDKYLLIDYSAFECQGLRMFHELGAMVEHVYPELVLPARGFTPPADTADTADNTPSESLDDDQPDR